MTKTLRDCLIGKKFRDRITKMNYTIMCRGINYDSEEIVPYLIARFEDGTVTHYNPAEHLDDELVEPKLKEEVKKGGGIGIF